MNRRDVTVAVHGARVGRAGAVLERRPDELRMPGIGEHDVDGEQTDRHRSRVISVLDHQVSDGIHAEGRHGRVHADVVRRLRGLRLGVALHDLPGRLELHDARRKGQDRADRVDLPDRVGGLQAASVNEVLEGLIDMNAVVDRAAVLVDEDLTPARLFDVAQERTTGAVRLRALEDRVDRRVRDDRRRPLAVHGLHGAQEVLPAATIERTLGLGVGERLEQRQRGGLREPVAARRAVFQLATGRGGVDVIGVGARDQGHEPDGADGYVEVPVHGSTSSRCPR